MAHPLKALAPPMTLQEIRALADEQHFAELDRSAGLGVELLDAQHPILRHPILLAARGDDRVHIGGVAMSQLKGRAFYWRTVPRSNGSFFSISSHLAHKLASVPGVRCAFLQSRPRRLGCGAATSAADDERWAERTI